MKTREKDFGDIQSLVGDEAIFYDFGREKILTPRNSPKYFLWIQSKMESAGEDILVLVKKMTKFEFVSSILSTFKVLLSTNLPRQLFARFAYVPLCCFIYYVSMGSFYSWLVRNNF